MKIMKYVVIVLALVSGLSRAAVINVPEDQPTIQDAIDVAVNGDEVLVAAGTYNETINFNGKAITVHSASGNPLDTRIDGSLFMGAFHVVQCVSGEVSTTELSGFRISGGNASGIASPDNIGGGMLILDSSPTVTNCHFWFNSADTFGGGIATINGNPDIRNCVFRGNSAGAGGGMYNNLSSLSVTNCLFRYNMATDAGGMLNVYSGSQKITNCIFHDNTSHGMDNVNNTTPPIVTNCTFVENTGYGIYNTGGSNAHVVNSIVWGNSLGGITSTGGLLTVSYSDVQDGVLPGAGNISINPLFVNLVGNDLHLQSDSPCLDVGNNAAIPLGIITDYDGLPRISNGTVDMGALEFQDDDGDGVPNDLDICPGFDDNVDTDNDGLPDGCDTPTVHNLTTATDYFTIQNAIDDALSGNVIVADPGTYLESINFIGKAITVRSTSGDPNDTIIDGTGNFHVVQFISSEGRDTVLEGFTITGGNANGPTDSDQRGGGMYCDITSPTVTNCWFVDNSAGSGGGMHNRSSAPTVTHCRFIGNSADSGGGMDNYGSSPVVMDCMFIGNSAALWEGGGICSYEWGSLTIGNCIFTSNTADKGGGVASFNNNKLSMTNCTFSNNTATSFGGGVYSYGVLTMMVDCIFSANSATYRGGGLSISSSSPTIIYCIFVGNISDGNGGAMYIGSSSYLTMTNCILSGNTTVVNGGGMYNYSSSPTLVNCTISGNTAGDSGGGLYNYATLASPMVSNCIFWKNSDIGGLDESAQIYGDYDTPTVNYSVVSGGWSGKGGNNIDADPLFVDPNGVDGMVGTQDDNLRLQSGSPCVDAADSSALVSIPIFDLDKNDRTVDVGPVVDTGAGSLTYLDMGAYEFQCSNFHGDVNCDGVVDFKDVAILCGNWLAGIE